MESIVNSANDIISNALSELAYNEYQNEIELSVTMNLGKWKQLKKQLTDNYPSWDLSAKITDMIYQAEKNFYPKEDV